MLLQHQGRRNKHQLRVTNIQISSVQLYLNTRRVQNLIAFGHYFFSSPICLGNMKQTRLDKCVLPVMVGRFLQSTGCSMLSGQMALDSQCLPLLLTRVKRYLYKLDRGIWPVGLVSEFNFPVVLFYTVQIVLLRSSKIHQILVGMKKKYQLFDIQTRQSHICIDMNEKGFSVISMELG